VRNIAYIAVLVAAALCVGGLASTALLAFAPQCGYDCETNRFGTFIFIEVICASGFIFVGYAAFRNSRVTVRRMLVVICMTSLVVLVPAWTSYGWHLHARYRQLEAERSPQPSVDFSHMMIATRAVPTHLPTTASSVEGQGEIAQWARCLVGAVDCEGKPRQVQLLCKGGIEYVDEEHWNVFTPIPSEDLPGISPLRSMKDLCTPS
jgi:hypothetical protein